jgi:hypothetical protein
MAQAARRVEAMIRFKRLGRRWFLGTFIPERHALERVPNDKWMLAFSWRHPRYTRLIRKVKP